MCTCLSLNIQKLGFISAQRSIFNYLLSQWPQTQAPECTKPSFVVVYRDGDWSVLAARWQREWFRRKDKQSEEESQTRGFKDCLQTTFLTDTSSIISVLSLGGQT